MAKYLLQFFGLQKKVYSIWLSCWDTPIFEYWKFLHYQKCSISNKTSKNEIQLTLTTIMDITLTNNFASSLPNFNVCNRFKFFFFILIYYPFWVRAAYNLVPVQLIWFIKYLFLYAGMKNDYTPTITRVFFYNKPKWEKE